MARNGHYKDMCYAEIGLCAHNVDIILDSIVNTVETTYVIT